MQAGRSARFAAASRTVASWSDSSSSRLMLSALFGLDGGEGEGVGEGESSPRCCPRLLLCVLGACLLSLFSSLDNRASSSVCLRCRRQHQQPTKQHTPSSARPPAVPAMLMATIASGLSVTVIGAIS